MYVLYIKRITKKMFSAKLKVTGVGGDNTKTFRKPVCMYATYRTNPSSIRVYTSLYTISYITTLFEHPNYPPFFPSTHFYIRIYTIRYIIREREAYIYTHTRITEAFRALCISSARRNYIRAAFNQRERARALALYAD